MVENWESFKYTDIEKYNKLEINYHRLTGNIIGIKVYNTFTEKWKNIPIYLEDYNTDWRK